MALRVKAEQRQKKEVTSKGEDRFTLTTLTPDPTLPKGYISVSQVSMYLRCPKQYEFRYVDGLKSPPALALVEGTCHHSAIELNNTNFVDKGENLEVSEVVEKFCDEFVSAAPTLPQDEWKYSGDSVNSVINRGSMMLENYMRNLAPTIKPVESPERKIELTFGGVPMLMFVDCEEKDRVLDYKTVSQKKSAADADNDLQLTVYAKATNKETVGFCCLVKSKFGDAVIVPSSRVMKDFKHGEALVSSVVDSIRKGAFPMSDPTGWACSKRFCGFWHLCRGKFK